MDLIKSGRIKTVIAESVAIQHALTKKKKLNRKSKKKTNWISDVRKQVQEGEINRASRTLADEASAVVPPTNEIFQQMSQMFPRAKDGSELLPVADSNATNLTHFNAKDIMNEVVKLQGAGGPSLVDAKVFKRLILNKTFGTLATRIVKAIAAILNRMSLEQMSNQEIEPLVAVRMVAIKKPDGTFRPVGIAEIVRLLIAKTIAKAIKREVKEVTGSRQVAGLQNCCEAAYKALNEMYENSSAVLILDAEGAFNNISRKGILKSVASNVPDAYQVIRNLYENPIPAHYNGKKFSIENGTIQGCPLSTSMYDLGINPLAKEMETIGITQVWMVDDLAVAGEPEELRSWFDKLRVVGPKYGYIINKSKSYILAKQRKVIDVFDGYLRAGDIKTAEGTKYLGGAIGTTRFKHQFMTEKISKINEKVTRLTRVAKTSPHAAYHLFTSSVKYEYTYLQRIGMDESLTSNIEVSCKRLVEGLVGQKIPNEKTLQQISNPTRYGGLAINTCRWAEETKELFERCEETSKELKQKLISNDNALPAIQENKEYKRTKEMQLRRIVRKQIDETQNLQE